MDRRQSAESYGIETSSDLVAPTDAAKPPNLPPSRRVVFGLLLAAVLLGGILPRVRSRPGETEVYALAARRMMGQEAIYRPEEKRAFTYPPFFALPYVPFELLPAPFDRAGWYTLNLLLLGVAVFVVHRSVRTSCSISPEAKGKSRTLYLLLVGVLAGRFLISPLEYQSHDLIVFALILGAIASWDSRRTWTAGIYAGLATACKATPLLFLPVLAVQRRWSACLTFMVCLTAATLLPDLLYPQSSGQLWSTSWYEGFISKVQVGATAAAEGAWDPWNHLNQSLAGTLYRLATPVRVPNERIWDVHVVSLTSNQLKVLTALAQALVFLTVLWIGWRGSRCSPVPSERRMQRLGEAGVVLCAMLLLSPMSSKQHFCTLLVPIAFCAADFTTRRRSLPVFLAFAVIFCLGTLAVKDVIGRPWGNHFLAVGSLTWCAAALLVANVSVLIQRGRDERQDQFVSFEEFVDASDGDLVEVRRKCTAA